MIKEEIDYNNYISEHKRNVEQVWNDVVGELPQAKA